MTLADLARRIDRPRRHRRIHLDEVCMLLATGSDLDAIADRLGVHSDSIAEAARRHGTPEQRARIRRARAEAREAKLAAYEASGRNSLKARTHPRLPDGRFVRRTA